MTTTVTKESLAARIAELESGARSLKEDYTLAAYKMLLATMEAEPVYQMRLNDGSLDASMWIEVSESEFNTPLKRPDEWSKRILHGHAPVALEHLRSIVADQRLLPRRKEWISGQQYSYVLLEEVEAIIDDACRAAMLNGGKP